MSDNHTDHSLSPKLTPVIPEQPAPPCTYLDSELDCPQLKQKLEAFQHWLAQAFNGGISAETLIAARSDFIDRLLQRLWTFSGFDEVPETALVAVGVMAAVNYTPCLTLMFWC
ncbi:[Protein-PII] uridylyltransferase [Yersinia aldovae ATCC 35236]|nr:[Protein-PII] uridylyltransferase [Yersinia aldovae ATCC 35236]